MQQALTEAQADDGAGALIAARTEPEAEPETKLKSNQSKAQADEPRSGAGALIAAKTEPEAEPETKLTSSRASLTAASMLAQICERAFMEHQLAARHFTFYSFCEHAPVLCVCARVSVRVCPGTAP